MGETSAIILAMLVGSLLGTVFFGGLWWTIQQSIRSNGPALLFGCSFLIRTFIAVAGFYFASQGDWRKLLACLVGFLLARIFVTRMTRLPSEKRARAIEERAL
jgi:F1F0 ATPase subunit 2